MNDPEVTKHVNSDLSHIEKIIAFTADVFSMDASEITGPSRAYDVALARHVAAITARRCGFSSGQIAFAFNRRHHTTGLQLSSNGEYERRVRKTHCEHVYRASAEKVFSEFVAQTQQEILTQ